MSTVAERFAENLSHYLERSPLSHEEVTARAEIDRSQIYRLLNGKQTCRLDTAIKIAGALGIEPAKLIDDIRWRPASAPTGKFTTKRPKRKRS